MRLALGVCASLLSAAAAPTDVFGHQASDSTFTGSPARRPAAMATEIAYTFDLSVNAAGGISRGAVGLGNLDAVLRLDAESLMGWPGASFLLYGLANHGGETTALTGDVQAADNIEAPTAVRLYEAWLQQTFPGSKLSVLVGLYDVNSEFDVIEAAQVFLNSSFGIGAELGASGPNGPSIFPVTSLGSRIQWRPSPGWYAQGVVLDGVPGDPVDPGSTTIRLSAEDGVLWVVEAGRLGLARGGSGAEAAGVGRDYQAPPLRWRIAAGLWRYDRRASEIGTTRSVRPDPGGYVLAEAYPYRNERTGRTLALFARTGFADGRTNRFAAFAGGGVTITGPFGGREKDVVGLGVASAFNGARYERTVREGGRPVSDSETAIELTYRARIAPWLTVQPDLQLILDPGTDPRLSDALLLTARVHAILP